MESTVRKIGIIGDFHAKDNLSYYEYIKDQRKSEKREIMDFIVDYFSDCNSVVFMGDNLNSKNNSSETIKDFIQFVERFNDKDVYIIPGNHEKRGNGKSAIDFMKEINKPNWHVITTPGFVKVYNHQMYFLPYMSLPELEVSNNLEGRDSILSHMDKNTEHRKYLFAHHAISDTFSNGGISTNTFNEIILPKKQLESLFEKVFAGHIHKPQEDGNTVITGSVFNNEAGETEKFVWKVNVDTNNIEKGKLPGRPIYKFENPSIKTLQELPSSGIIKVVVTSRDVNIENIKEELKRFDCHVLLEHYPNERKKIHFDEGALDFSINNLLKMYSEEKKIPLDKLMRGMLAISDK